MSQNSVNEFAKSLGDNEQDRERVSNLDSSSDIVEFAKARGFELTVGEVEATLSAAGPDEHEELPADTLEAVSGGLQPSTFPKQGINDGPGQGPNTGGQGPNRLELKIAPTAGVGRLFTRSFFPSRN